MSIEKRFNIPFISALALREKQNQQNSRPIIAVHKWFARRPGTLFHGLILSEFSEEPLREAFYTSKERIRRVSPRHETFFLISLRLLKGIRVRPERMKLVKSVVSDTLSVIPHGT
jgi:hypothetical protein